MPGRETAGDPAGRATCSIGAVHWLALLVQPRVKPDLPHPPHVLHYDPVMVVAVACKGLELIARKVVALEAVSQSSFESTN